MFARVVHWVYPDHTHHHVDLHDYCAGKSKRRITPYCVKISGLSQPARPRPSTDLTLYVHSFFLDLSSLNDASHNFIRTL